MLTWVVIYRRHLQHSALTPSSLPTAPTPVEDPEPGGSRRGHSPLLRYVLYLQQGRKITALALGWVEDSVVRSDSRGFGVAEASSKCGVASIV